MAKLCMCLCCVCSFNLSAVLPETRLSTHAVRSRAEHFLVAFGHEVSIRLVTSAWVEDELLGLLQDVQHSLELPPGLPAHHRRLAFIVLFYNPLGRHCASKSCVGHACLRFGCSVRCSFITYFPVISRKTALLHSPLQESQQ